MKTLKERAEDVLKGLRADIPENRELYLSEAVELLQELTNAPEPEPVMWKIFDEEWEEETTLAKVAEQYKKEGHTVIAYYTAPPAPSVPDWQGWAMRLIDFIEGAEVSSGMCCCGDDMARHASPINCGHSPVDMWDNCVKNLRAEFDKFVATAPTPAEPPEAVARDAEPWKLLLENLVEGLNKTHWCSLQGTAHFDEYLQEAISAIERDKLKGQS